MFEKIYHYTKDSIALEHILTTKCLRTNSLKEMNDPKENQQWAFSGKYDLEAIYPDSYTEGTEIEHQFKLGSEMRECVQAISFSSNYNEKGPYNEMLWAHYGGSHKGVCIEIDKNKFIEENNLNPSDFILETVVYNQITPPFISFDITLSKEENFDRTIRAKYKNLFLTKSSYWEKEEEVRLLLFKTSEYKFLSIRDSLTAIFLGLHFDYSKRSELDILLDERQTEIYDIYYEDNVLKKTKRDYGDYREFIYRKYTK